MSAGSVLTAEQREHFIARGFVRLEGCFGRDAAAKWVEAAAPRLGCDLSDPTTWKEERVHLPATTGLMVRDFAPRAWGAIQELLGGAARIKDADMHSWPDSFVVNLCKGAGRPWRNPAESWNQLGWHLDGPDALKFLDSPEVGLITYVLWTDVLPKSGGTFLACDSVGEIARYLRERPAGVPKQGLPMMSGIVDKCRDFAELTGRAGDVVLVHPFMAHAESNNPSGRPRFMTPRIVELKEAMRFDRPKPKDYSPVELSILRGLGLKRVNYRRGAARRGGARSSAAAA